MNYWMTGGEGGIRTHETVARLHAFQACAFDHSATSPKKSHRVLPLCGLKTSADPSHTTYGNGHMQNAFNHRDHISLKKFAVET